MPSTEMCTSVYIFAHTGYVVVAFKEVRVGILVLYLMLEAVL